MTQASILSALAALAAIVALLLFGARIARLTGLGRRPSGAGTRLALLDSLHLDPRRRLMLVQCDSRSVLLLTGQQDQIVGWLPDKPL